MTNDPPTSLRMGFGFQQARAAGAPYRAPRTVWGVNFETRERRAEKEIASLAKRYPSLKKRFAEIVREAKAQEYPTLYRGQPAMTYFSNQDILLLMKREVARRERIAVRFALRKAQEAGAKLNRRVIDRR
jgi:hypothetical protein